MSASTRVPGAPRSCGSSSRRIVLQASIRPSFHRQAHRASPVGRHSNSGVDQISPREPSCSPRLLAVTAPDPGNDHGLATLSCTLRPSHQARDRGANLRSVHWYTSPIKDAIDLAPLERRAWHETGIEQRPSRRKLRAIGLSASVRVGNQLPSIGMDCSGTWSPRWRAAPRPPRNRNSSFGVEARYLASDFQSLPALNRIRHVGADIDSAIAPP